MTLDEALKERQTTTPICDPCRERQIGFIANPKQPRVVRPIDAHLGAVED